MHHARGTPSKAYAGARAARLASGYTLGLNPSWGGAVSLSPRTLALGATLSVIAACSSSSGVGQGTGVVVTVSPAAASLAPGWSQLFTATVTGASDGSVAWGVVEPGGGQVDASGRYTAPQATGSSKYPDKGLEVLREGVSSLPGANASITPRGKRATMVVCHHKRW